MGKFMFIKKYNRWKKLNEEAKYFIYSDLFRIKSLIESDIYSQELIEKWKSEYSIDNFAVCLFVTLENNNKIKKFDMPIELSISKKIKNKYYFDDKSRNKDGYFIKDSLIQVDGMDVYLYIFRKNSNVNKRARQIRGFIYENEIKRENKIFSDIGYTNTWDGYGSLKRDFIEKRMMSNNVEAYIGGNKIDIDNFYGADYFWNIKTVKNNNEINLGDIKRIYGIKLYKNNDEIKLKYSDEKNLVFMFVVSIFNNKNEIMEEYFIKVPTDIWQKHTKIDLSLLEEMYNKLYYFKLNGMRTSEMEIEWKKFIEEYKKLTINSIIKIRFKRDSKGQLRIQCSMSMYNFKNIFLKEEIEYIKITSTN
jgi:hypothetical protein